MNLLTLFRPKPEPAPLRFVVATRKESAKARSNAVSVRLELEMLKLHTPPDQYEASIRRAAMGREKV